MLRGCWIGYTITKNYLVTKLNVYKDLIIANAFLVLIIR